MNQFLQIENLKILPLLPFLYLDSKKVRKKTPVLPPAENPVGATLENYSEERKVLIIGESTMAGLGVKEHQDGFPGALAKHLAERLKKNIQWEVFAKSGYTVKQINERIINHIEGDFDMIVIGVGGNDAFTLNSTQMWAQDILNLIQMLNERFPHSECVFINMPPIHTFPGFTPLLQRTLGNRVELLGKKLKELTDRIINVHFINEKIEINTWIKKLDDQYEYKDFFSDGVHPSRLTYQTWAKEVSKYIVDNNLLE